MGYVQCNLAVVPRADAFDFLLYCQRNHRACPVLEVCDPGDPEPKRLAPGADLRIDLPRYAVYRSGERLADVTDLRALWRDDLVAFLIGSGITFDDALERAGVPTDRHRWVLRSTLPTVPAGRFRGDMIVTMRWLTPQQAIRATQVSSRFPQNHGAPIHIGDPHAIGADLARAALRSAGRAHPGRSRCRCSGPAASRRSRPRSRPGRAPARARAGARLHHRSPRRRARGPESRGGRRGRKLECAASFDRAVATGPPRTSIAMSSR